MMQSRMFEPKRILVAVDLSECSAAALRLGARIAEKFSATLAVLPAAPVLMLLSDSETCTEIESRT